MIGWISQLLISLFPLPTEREDIQGDMCVLTADSLSCTSEINTRL